MTNKDLMYSFAERYVDNILLTLVESADEILSDTTILSLMQTLVDLEAKDRLARRSAVMFGYEPLRTTDATAYRTVLYNTLIRGMNFDRE